MSDHVNQSIQKTVVDLWNQGESIKGISRKTGIGHQKVRKILITAGDLYQTKRSQEVKQMLSEGYSPQEIADKMNLSMSALNTYLPYTKCIYLDVNPTKNAINIRKFYLRKRLRENGDDPKQP